MLCTGWAITALVSGCGRDRGPERVVVSGTVTYNGKPLSEGMIRFVPLPNCPVPAAGAPISDGRYQVDRLGGVPVGTHKIQIEAYRKRATPSKPDAIALPPRGRGDLPEQYIPKKYNADTVLEITIPPGSRAITQDFNLTN